MQIQGMFQATFQTVWESLLKTSVMMIGELDYTTMFYSDDETQNVTNSLFTGSDVCIPGTFFQP